MTQAIPAGSTISSPDASICRLLLSSIAFASGTSTPFAGAALLYFVIGNDLLSTIFGCLLSPIASGGLLSAVLSHFSSAILDHLLFSVASDDFLFAIFGSDPFSLVLSTSS